MLQELIAKTITLNLAETRGVLGNILFCGTEVIRGKSDPSHVLHRFMTLLPHAGSVSKATLDSARRDGHDGYLQGKWRGKSRSRGGLRLGPRAGRAGAVRLVVSRTTCRRPRSQGPSPFRAGVYMQPGPYAPTGGGQAVAAPAHFAPVTSE